MAKSITYVLHYGLSISLFLALTNHRVLQDLFDDRGGSPIDDEVISMKVYVQ